MSSKTSRTTRFWRFIALLALVAVEFGCGGGGGGSVDPGPGGGSPGGPDTTAPTFGGLQSVGSNSTGAVTLTSNTAADSGTTKEQLTYLIYVSENNPTVDRSGTPRASFTGAQACTSDNCSFVITDLKTDGTKYFFASHAQDTAGNKDQDAHPKENADLSIAPRKFTFPGGPPPPNPGGPPITPTSLNVNKANHATHPYLTVIGDTPYVIWEECAAPTQASPSGTAPDHPCNTKEASQIFMKRFNGTSWELVKDPVTGRDDLNRNPTQHAHSPTLASDTSGGVFASWREFNRNLFVQKFNSSNGTWENITALQDGGERPALTRHSSLLNNLGIAYEFSPNFSDHSLLYFRQWDGSSWGVFDSQATLNKTNDQLAEAPVFSRNGTDLYITWKESTKTVITPTGHDHQIPNIMVKKWNGSSWDFVGGSINLDPNSEARFPSVDVLGVAPYIAWHECTDPGCGKEYIFVKHWDANQNQWVQDSDAGTCTALANQNCGNLNQRSTFAKTPSLSVFGDRVFVGWAEQDSITAAYKIQLKSRTVAGPWNFNGTLNIDPSKNAYSPLLVSNGGLYVAWIEEDANHVLQLYVAKTN